MRKNDSGAFSADGEPRFQVLKNGKCCMSGDVSLLYDKETRKQIRSAGYTIKVGGKVYKD